MGNESPPHLIANLQFNLQIKMQERKLRFEMGLLNTLQGGLCLLPQGPGAEPHLPQRHVRKVPGGGQARRPQGSDSIEKFS